MRYIKAYEGFIGEGRSRYDGLASKLTKLTFRKWVDTYKSGNAVINYGDQIEERGRVNLEFDFEAQCRSVFDNVRAVLEASGSSWNNLVDVTVFLVNMRRDFATYNRVYAEYFKEAQPCRTTVEINSLPTPIAIELKCIATID